MENIRRYIETVYGEFKSFEQLAAIREECICLIANKLLTMDSTNILCIYNHRTTKTNQKYPSVNL